MFRVSLIVLSSFFLWPLCILSFDLLLLISPLASSIFSCNDFNQLWLLCSQGLLNNLASYSFDLMKVIKRMMCTKLDAIFYVYVLRCYASLRSEFHVVISVAIFACERWSVRLCLQLFVGGDMSYLRCLYLFTWWCETHIVLWFSSYRVHYVDSFSGLSIFDCPFGIL